MPFAIKNGKKKCLLVLNDRVDIGDVRDMLNAVKRVVDSDIEVDMKEVSFMDPSILQLLIATKAALKMGGKNLVIKARSEEAEGVMKLAGAAEALK